MDLHRYVIDWNKQKWESKNDRMYKESGEENQWPWFCPSLDPDIARYLAVQRTPNAKVLDLGTCSGPQAIELAKLGYNVVGTDISETAIAKALEEKAKLADDVQLEFLIDDILDSKLENEAFDYVFDRGCFHCICFFGFEDYLNTIHRILKPGGVLLLKCMSDKEQRFRDYNQFGEVKVPMPAHLNAEEIHKIFDNDKFTVESIKDSYFYSSTINPAAQATLSIIHKK